MIVDLDRSMPRVWGPGDRPTLSRPAISSAFLVLGCVAFAVAVLVGRPAGVAAPNSEAIPVAGAAVPRGQILTPLQLPRSYVNVDLAAMPDRLANEAAPWTLRSVVVIRGAPGVASVEGPAVISWTENGIAYWLASPTRTTTELIQIANDLR